MEKAKKALDVQTKLRTGDDESGEERKLSWQVLSFTVSVDGQLNTQDLDSRRVGGHVWCIFSYEAVEFY